MSVPSDAPVWRPIICPTPTCKRYLGASDQYAGKVKLYCKGCRCYQVIDLSDTANRRTDADAPIRLISDRDALH